MFRKLLRRLGSKMPLSKIPNSMQAELTSAELPSGNVIQLVHTTGTYNKGFTSNDTYTSTGYVNITGATISITPTFSNSKIFIISQNQIYITEDSNNAWRGANLKIVRTISGTDTDISDDETGYGESQYTDDNAHRYMTYVTRHAIDSPNTTSAVSYRVQVASKLGNSILINKNSYGSGGHLIAMEIKV